MIAPFDERLFHHKGREGNEGFGYLDYKLRALRAAIVEGFRGSRKFSGGPWLPGWGFARAKTPRAPSPEVKFLCGLCAFAGDIPSFGCGSAGLGWWRL